MAPKLFLASSLLAVVAAAADFDGLPTQSSSSVPQYQRLEIAIKTTATTANPYDQRQIAIDFSATTPSGKTFVAPAFYDGKDGSSLVWRVRFSPKEVGVYSGRLLLNEAGQALEQSAPVSFTATEGSGDGFLLPGTTWSFQTDSGRTFRGVGENVAWETANWRGRAYSYDLILGELSAKGANFFRTWMCSWNLGLEWNRQHTPSSWDGYYNLAAIKRMDELCALSDQLGMRFMLALEYHGALLPDSDWGSNSYNSAKGGPCATPAAFFTNAEAKAMFKNRIRYIQARWGAFTSFGVWEFFNEIDNVVFPLSIPHADITAWYDEMSRYIRELDGYARPITTSISHRDIAGMNAIPTLDFNQKHIYITTQTIPSAIEQYVAATKKPYVIGEFGFDWDWTKDFDSRGADFDYHYKMGLWLGAFTETPILPMTWWWEFFHDRGMAAYIQDVRNIVARMSAAGKGQYEKLSASGGSLTVRAVRCGNDVYVLLLNDTIASVTASPTVATRRAGQFSVRSLDPETRQWTTHADVSSTDSLSVGSVTLAPRAMKIYAFADATQAAIVQAPVDTAATVGGKASFFVEASNASGFEWWKDGVKLAGKTSAFLALDSVSTGDAGTYSVKVFGADGSVLQKSAVLSVLAPGPARLVNISTRSWVGVDNKVQVAGFVIRGTSPKQVLIRAAGPSLAGFGVGGTLADPVLEIFRGDTKIYSNGDWAATAEWRELFTTLFVRAGAFGFSASQGDAAVFLNLAPGDYTAVMSGTASGTGVGLVEVYELDVGNPAARFSNISTRSMVRSGAEVQIGGFVIGEGQTKRILIRASGPALQAFGIGDFLPDPTLKLVRNGVVVADNDDWDSALVSAFASAGAFAWTSGSRDAALLVELGAGQYTAEVGGKGSASGVALIEIYEVD